MMRVVSGIQPSGALHLGNYFGAIQAQLTLQHTYPGECYFFLADYHALTTCRDAKKLQRNTLEAAASYLALGLLPSKALLFRQSDVPEVCELTWLLATVTGMGLLTRSPSYKDKADQGLPASVGLFSYPLLMAADILAYGGTKVPVGQDQLPHLNLAQDVATRWNETYGPLFPRPEAVPFFAVVPGTDGRKMSKSYGNTIPLFEGRTKSVDKIVSDSTPFGNPLPWETCTTAALIRLAGKEDEIERIRSGYLTGSLDNRPFGYGHAKQELKRILDRTFEAAQTRYHKLLTPSGMLGVEEVLEKSAKIARDRAQQTLHLCRTACGLAP